DRLSLELLARIGEGGLEDLRLEVDLEAVGAERAAAQSGGDDRRLEGEARRLWLFLLRAGVGLFGLRRPRAALALRLGRVLDRQLADERDGTAEERSGMRRRRRRGRRRARRRHADEW